MPSRGQFERTMTVTDVAVIRQIARDLCARGKGTHDIAVAATDRLGEFVPEALVYNMLANRRDPRP